MHQYKKNQKHTNGESWRFSYIQRNSNNETQVNLPLTVIAFNVNRLNSTMKRKTELRITKKQNKPNLTS